MDKNEKQPHFDLKADAEYIIEKYKCKWAAGQIWFRDRNRWLSAANVEIQTIITREFGARYRSSFGKLTEIEKFVKYITQDKHSIEITKSLSVYFLNGIVNYDKNCFTDKDNVREYEAQSFHKYLTEEEKATFTPSIINDNFIGTIGSEELNKIMDTDEGKEVIRIVNKYYDFISMDGQGKVRPEVRDYLLALGWLGHSTATLEQITYLLGDGANGKSWFTNKVLYELVGKSNFGAFKLDKINDTFGYQPFLNKTLMVDADAKNSLIEDDKFKSLAGTDVVNINIKNKDAVSAELFSTVILCTNHAPKYVDYSSSMSRRMVLIKLYSCVYENINSPTRVKSKMALTDAEQKIFFGHLSRQYQRSLMFDAFCRIYDVENKLITTPKESSDLNKDLERDNNELYAWCEDEQWIQKALDDSDRGELFVYPQYIYDKYKEYYKENNDGSDKGFVFKRNGVWQRFKELMESKYRNTFIFNVNEKARQRIGGSMPTGFVIKKLNRSINEISDTEVEEIIQNNNLKIKEYLAKIEEAKNEIQKLKNRKQQKQHLTTSSSTTNQTTTVVAVSGSPDSFRLSKEEMDKPKSDDNSGKEGA